MTHSRTVHVAAPSRLHFGMLSFGHRDQRQFGGVGAMIDAPGLAIDIRAAERLDIAGPLADRAAHFVRRFCDSSGLAEAPPCRIEIVSAPPDHAGLGVGTQLGLAIAAGLRAFLDCEPADPPTLAALVGRGERSAIGTYGFVQGGLLVEAGKLAGEPLSPLVARVELPAAWRFVLALSRNQSGLSGEAEQQAFAKLPPVPREATATLCHEIVSHLLPAAKEARFDEFSETLYRYGHRAGLCFAANQGGPFANRRLAELVETIRGLGIRGVGQTSWGPTLFALMPDEEHAREFIAAMRKRVDPAEWDLVVAAPDNRGARITRAAESVQP